MSFYICHAFEDFTNDFKFGLKPCHFVHDLSTNLIISLVFTVAVKPRTLSLQGIIVRLSFISKTRASCQRQRQRRAEV